MTTTQRLHPPRPFLVQLLCSVFFGLLLSSSDAAAKPYKGAELITHETFKYGAFEARIRAAAGSGMITAFFLWKDGSELEGTEWQEQDFEIFGKDGRYQSQVMTPGNPRTEHVVNSGLPTPAWENYYTFRMEWTPDYLAFYVDGNLVRTETDPVEYAKLLDPNRAEPAQLRLSLWAGDFDWSGELDESAVPAATFVEFCEVFDYTPGSGPNGSDFTSRWRDEFDTIDGGRWWRANWTFEYAVNDYVSRNMTTRDGKLLLALTDEAGSGTFPFAVPADNPVVPWDGESEEPPPAFEGEAHPVPGLVEAEEYHDYFDTGGNNQGDTECGSGGVDLELTSDEGGGCNIGWTAPDEWTEYQVDVSSAGLYEVVLRVASNVSDRSLHLEVDGSDVSGPIQVPQAGWQDFFDVVVPLELSAGMHNVRVVHDTGLVNLNYLDFYWTQEADADGPAATCDGEVSVYEAESMLASAGGATPNGWNLWTNGTLSASHEFSRSGASLVRVVARGESAQGIAPHMLVRVGARILGEVDVTATSYSEHDFFYTPSETGGSSTGPLDVVVEFDNDYYDNGQDRNLLVDAVWIDPCAQLQ